MARYFIDLRDADGVIPDEEGAEYAHLEEALDEAKASARDLARNVDYLMPNDVCVEVRDAQGRTVAALTVAEVMAHPRHPHSCWKCGWRIRAIRISSRNAPARRASAFS